MVSFLCHFFRQKCNCAIIVQLNLPQLNRICLYLPYCRTLNPHFSCYQTLFPPTLTVPFLGHSMLKTSSSPLALLLLFVSPLSAAFHAASLLPYVPFSFLISCSLFQLSAVLEPSIHQLLKLLNTKLELLCKKHLYIKTRLI